MVPSEARPNPSPEAGPRSVASRRVGQRVVRLLALVVGIVVLLLGLAALALWFASGTRAFNQSLDARALAFMARTAARASALSDPPAAARLPFHDAAELQALTRWTGPPLAPTFGPLPPSRVLDRPGLVQERLAFPSGIALAHTESNLASAYVYRQGPLGARPIVLWVPGLFVSNLAMTPISWFVGDALEHGADVVLYVPPYHLERTPAGFRSGEAFFATMLDDHLNAFAQELSDLRRRAGGLQALGPRPVGGFGGSLGALELLRLATWDDSLDFLTVFIPVVRPTDLIDRPESAPMRERLVREGGSLEAMRAVYGAFDMTIAPAPRGLLPGRISVLYGRYDIVGPSDAVEVWARAWGVKRLFPFERGHTLALFNRTPHVDYQRALDEDLRALR